MTLTGMFIVTLMIVAGIYDAIVVMRTGLGCSISRFLQRTGFKSPVFVFAIGFICGHVFGYMAPEMPEVPPVQVVAPEEVPITSSFPEPLSIADPQFIFPCRIIDVHDGDTLKVETKFNLSVRLLRCWAPELDEKGGQASHVNLKKLANGKNATVSIPLAENLTKVTTMGRFLGDVFVDGVSLSDQQVMNGFATKEK